ncbi:LysR family transcriptional regulator [Bacillus sp. AFS031507]|uniref:LysR family transcriptional regulator n=1 Tax=Bacillus sp. AFS031507 TaxID=2033496 RepID=UPI000BFB581D|nr:LysR family transcriptional regulator [Bacillus sp. AFS031507]PGY13013.1 LysR family transcriptional regulator [Bacillus sp. AFS031507]
MNIDKLVYLFEVAKTESFSIASQNLHVTQSTISQAVLNLEKELGVSIFQRSRQGIIPTEEGKIVIKKAHEIIMKFQELKDEVKTFTDSISGELKISTISGLLKLLLEPLSTFKENFPYISIDIFENTTLAVIEDVVNQKSDIGLITIYDDVIKNRDDITYETLLEGKMRIYVSKNSPLVFYETITPQELLQQTLVLYNGDSIKWFIDDFTKKYGPLKIFFTSNDSEGVMNAVQKGLAITIGPSYSNFHPYLISGEIVAIDLVYDRLLTTSIGWIHLKNKHLPLYADKFIKDLKIELKSKFNRFID